MGGEICLFEARCARIGKEWELILLLMPNRVRRQLQVSKERAGPKIVSSKKRVRGGNMFICSKGVQEQAKRRLMVAMLRYGARSLKSRSLKSKPFT